MASRVFKTQEKIEVFNYRPVVYAAAGLAFGILSGAAFRNSLIGIIAAICVIVALAVLGLVRNWRIVRLVTIAVGVGFALFFLAFTTTSVEPGQTSDAYIEGRITGIEFIEEEHCRYVLEKISINGESVKGKAYLDYEEKFEIGDLIAAEGSVTSWEINPFNLHLMPSITDGIRHKINGKTAVKAGESKLRLGEYVRMVLSERYVKYMGEEAGGLALALSVGDRSYLDENVKDAMRAGGISHIIAVSGLHVGFLCGIIYGIMRLMRRSKSRSLLAVVLVLLGYGIVTAFPVGVVRASIMAICMLLASRDRKRYDPLNALALAAIILLIINPLSLFDVSFLMSFGALLGIICFYSTFARFFRTDDKWLSKISGAMCLSLSANTYIVGISAAVFGTFALYFAIANVIAVPYISFVYTLLVPVGLLAMIIEPLGYLLVPIKYLLLGFIAISKFFASLPLALVNVDVSFAVAAVYGAALFFVSKFNLLNYRIKIGYALASTVVIVLLIAL